MSVLDVFNHLAKIKPRFTEAQLGEMINWFDKNSKHISVINEGEPLNVVTIEQFLTFLELKKFHRRSFNYPSYLEIMKEVENVHVGITRVLTQEQFIYILNKWVLEPDIKHELTLAFKLFDTENRNYLEIDEIKTIVTEYGEAFHETETREILRDANVCGDGKISYEDFIESMFSTAPELYEIKTEYLYDNPDEDPSVPPEPEAIVEEKPLPPPPPPLPKNKDKDNKKKKS